MKKETLADRLNLAMEQSGMSQGALAKASGVAQPTIWRLTSGNARGSTKIVEIANVKPNLLPYYSKLKSEVHNFVLISTHAFYMSAACSR